MQANIDVADEAFINYDFGEGVQVIHHNGWTSDGETMAKVVFVEYPEDGPDDDTHKLMFTCRFGQDGVLVDVSALDCASGNAIGVRSRTKEPA